MFGGNILKIYKAICIAFLSVLLLFVFSGCNRELSPDEKSGSVSKTSTEEIGDDDNMNQEMIDRSLVRVGNTDRLMKAINKAKNNEKVNIVYIGGSITQGCGASNPHNCYAYKSFQMFPELFTDGTAENWNYINSGIGGTSSTLGLVRSDTDVDAYQPDIVFIEFAVNDKSDLVSQYMYESLVRKTLECESQPAVILLFTITESGYSAQSNMAPIGFYYDLGMISVGNAITPEIKSGNMKFNHDYADDDVHPNDKGHELVAELIKNYLNKASEAESKPYIIPEKTTLPYNYSELRRIKADDGLLKSEGSFKLTKESCFTYTDAYIATGDEKNKPMVIEDTFELMIICYKQDSDKTMGSADVYIDDKLANTLNGYSDKGWGNIESEVVLYSHDQVKHKVEIKMNNDESDKHFVILDIAVY